jgi:hypothetical protein
MTVGLHNISPRYASQKIEALRQRSLIISVATVDAVSSARHHLFKREQWRLTVGI